MDFERLDRSLRWAICGLLTVVLIFAPLAIGAIRSSDFVIVEWLVFAAGVLQLVRLAVGGGKMEMPWPGFLWPVLGFVVYAVFRYRFAEVEYVARLELAHVVVYVLALVLWLWNLPRREAADGVVAVLVVLGMGLSLLALYQYHSHPQMIWDYARPAQFWLRGSGTFRNPNSLAGFLSMVLPLAVAYAFTGRMNVTARALLVYAALVMLAGAGATISRGGWLAVGASVLFVLVALVLRKGRRRWIALLTLLALVGAFGLFWQNSMAARQRWLEIVKSGEMKEYRLDLWKPTLAMWRDHFWFGVGPAHFDVVFPQYRTPTLQGRPQYAHNDYLNILTDWGLVGGVFLLAALVLASSCFWQLWRRVQERQADQNGGWRSNRLALLLGGGGALTGFLVHSLTDFNLHIPSNAFLLVTVFALMAVQGVLLGDRPRAPWKPGVRWSSGVVLAVALVFLGLHAARLMAETRPLRVAEKAKYLSDEQLHAYQAAFAVEPANSETALRIGELLRQRSWLERDGYQQVGAEAVTWFRKAAELDPHDALSRVHLGMTLDWIGRGDEAGSWIDQGVALDPNNCYTTAIAGWHYLQRQDYRTAVKWLQRSQDIFLGNEYSLTYLKVAKERLKEAEAAASGKPPAAK